MAGRSSSSGWSPPRRTTTRCSTAPAFAHTFTLVEWNPVPGRRLLAEAVAERLPFWGRAYVVEPAWHAAISTNPRLQFMEFFAKNVAVRRSTADAILTTNSDVFLSEALVARLARRRSRTSTSIARCATTSIATATGAGGGEAVLADPRHHLRVNQLTAPEFSNAAGDFLLLTAATWRRLRGFNETVRFAKIHKDGQFCHRAWIEGLPFDTLGPIWHLDHDGSYSNVGVLHGAPDAPYGPEWPWRDDYRNPDGWGLDGAIEEPATGPIVWLRHPSPRGAAASSDVEQATRESVPPVDARAVGRELLTTLGAVPAALDGLAGGARPVTDGASRHRRDRTGRPRGSRLRRGRRASTSPGSTPPTRASSGTVRCGYVVRALDDIADAGVDVYVTGLLDPAVEARLRARRVRRTGARRAGRRRPTRCRRTCPSELAMLLDVQRAAADDPRAGRRRRRAARRASPRWRRWRDPAASRTPTTRRWAGRSAGGRTKRCAPSRRSSTPMRPTPRCGRGRASILAACATSAASTPRRASTWPRSWRRRRIIVAPAAISRRWIAPPGSGSA